MRTAAVYVTHLRKGMNVCTCVRHILSAAWHVKWRTVDLVVVSSTVPVQFIHFGTMDLMRQALLIIIINMTSRIAVHYH